MNEYITIAVFMIAIYFLLSFIKRKYLEKYKWKNIISHSSALVLFLTLFIWGYKSDGVTGFSTFRILLITLSFIYFSYQIYKDIKVLNIKKISKG
jgi:hypothetical protein